MNNSSLLAFATLVGTIVGAGIFALPYAVAQSGLIISLFLFALLGGVVLLLHLFFGEFALRTSQTYRLPGYANVYLGRWAKYLATFAIVFSIGGALLAYTIIGGEFLRIAAAPFIDMPETAAALLFWASLSVFIFGGIRVIAKAELFMVAMLFAVVVFVVLFALPQFAWQDMPMGELAAASLFLPYGVILFAFTGWAAIPEIADLFKSRKEKKRLDNVIVWASVATFLLYAAFAFMVVGVSGVETSEDALSGLVPFLGPHIVLVGVLFGLVAVAASFLVLGNYVKNSLRHDFGVPYVLAAAIATLVPIALFLAGVRDFPEIIGIVGAVSLGAIEGVLIVLIWRKAKRLGDRQPEYAFSLPMFVLWGVAAILLLGAGLKLFLLAAPSLGFAS